MKHPGKIPDKDRGKKPAHHEIAAIAYALYEQEGRPENKALEHWFNAETMVESQFGQGKNHREPELENRS